jgi:hypothetical protein
MQLKSKECGKRRRAKRSMKPCHVHIAHFTASVSNKSKRNYMHFLVSALLNVNIFTTNYEHHTS